jgi:DNA-binding SARP family transcriptional activator/WD40 repeat protein
MQPGRYRRSVDFLVLGPLRVFLAGTEVEVRGSKERLLLSHLVAYGGHVVPVADLIETLWEDDPPRSAAKSLQTYVLRLRNALEPGRANRPRLLVTEGAGYRLAIGTDDTDAGRFAMLAALSAQALSGGRFAVCRDAARDALRLWRGPPYPGCEGTTFGRAEGRRLEELRLGVLEDLHESELALGLSTAAVAGLERQVSEHPLRERMWALLMLGLYRTGRQGEALAAYDRVREYLGEELGVDPGTELRAMHRRILSQDPTLSAPVAGSRVPEVLREPADPLLDRDDLLARLHDAWATARAGSSVSVLLRGPAGAGATRVAAALANHVAKEGATVALAPAGELRETALVVDEGGEAQPPPCGMVLRLAPPDAVPRDAELVVDLAPLGVDAVRSLAAEYVDQDDVEELTTHLLRTGPAWPGRLHGEAGLWVRARAYRTVEAAVSAAEDSSQRLAAARSVLSDGLQTLGQAAERAPLEPDRCPWRGLAAHEIADAPWFAGRERLVAELLTRTATSRLVALVGASGTGKSSLLRAGMLAAMAAGALPGSATWRQVVMRPGANPLRELSLRALGAGGGDVGEILSRLLSDESTDGRTVLVVDQLEEAWTSCSDEGQRAAFLDVLADLASDPAGCTVVVVAVRADYVAQLAEHPALAALVADGTVLVGSMTGAEVERVVTRPAARAGLDFDDGLVDTIVEDAAAEPGLLPLLSVALSQLWERRSGHRLTFAAYVGSGGLSGAVGRLAEQTWAGLDEAERAAGRQVLLRLAGPGQGDAVSRRRVPVAELTAMPQPAVARVIERLVAARLITRGDGAVEVAHEALFREWPRLRGWLADDSADRALQGRLAVAALEWDSEQRAEALLWRGTRLEAARELAQVRPEYLNATELAFLKAAEAASRRDEDEVRARAARATRQNRRLRALLTGVLALLLLVLSTSIVAVRSRSQAAAAATRAEQAATQATARALAATALNQPYGDLALLMAVEAVHRDASPETYGALLTLLTRTPDVIVRHRTFDRYMAVTAAHDGSHVYLVDNEGGLTALDAQTGREIWRAKGAHNYSGASVSGPLVLAAYDVNDLASGVEIRDGSNGRLVHDVPVPRKEWLAQAAHLRAGQLEVVTDDALVILDPPTGHVVHRVPWRTPHESFVRFLRDGTVAAWTGTGSTSVLDPTSGRIRTLPGQIMAASADGQWVATRAPGAHAGHVVIQMRSASSWRVAASTDVTGDVEFPVFAGSRFFLPVGSDVDVFDTASLDLTAVLRGQDEGVMNVAAAGPNQSILWTAGRDGQAIAHDLTHRRGVEQTSTASTPVWLGDADAGGRVAIETPVYEDRPNPALLASVPSGRALTGELPVPDGCQCQVNNVDMAADSSLAVGALDEYVPTKQGLSLSPGGGGRVAVWTVPDGRITGQWTEPWRVSGVALSPDGKHVAVTGSGGYTLAETLTGRPIWTVESPGQKPDTAMAPLAWDPHGSRFAMIDGDGVAMVDAGTGRRTARTTLPESHGVLQLAWTPDGHHLVAGSGSGRLYILDPTTLTETAPRRIVTGGYVLDLVVSPDGRTLATLGTGGDVTLFDTGTWRPYGAPVIGAGQLFWGFLSLNNDRLTVFSQTGAIVTLSTRHADWVADACRIANRQLSADEFPLVNPGTAYRATCP